MSELEYPQNQRILDRMKEEIDSALGIGMWEKISCNLCPNAKMDVKQLNVATQMLIEEFDILADNQTATQVFSNVKHALRHSDFAWARNKFLQYNDIDLFAEAVLQDSMGQLQNCLKKGETFYGQPVTQEVLEYAESIKDLFYGRRTMNTITATAIPYMVQEYLNTKDERTKRYHACHCPFAKESILMEKTVSKTMCYCSLGHTKVFWEAALDTFLDGDVLHSALQGDTSCQFILYLPDEIMQKYVK